jgi:pilus assembly protein Flp/PilA
MRKQLTSVVKDFARDERGASLLEYTILLAMISVAVIATIGGVGDWISGRWTTLSSNLTNNQN